MMIHERGKDVINNYLKEHGLENRVDAIGKIAQEHICPVRMRSVMNEAVHRNEEKKEANIEYLSNGHRVLESITRHMSVFNRKDLERTVRIVPDASTRDKLVEDALSSKSLISLYDESGLKTGYYTIAEIRAEEEKILRLSGYVEKQNNIVAGACANKGDISQLLSHNKSDLSPEQEQALSELVFNKSGLQILRGRAGTGKSYVLGAVRNIAQVHNVNVIGLAPTHIAKKGLASLGY
jgi:tRNA(Met) C34 N-acetyltransferase TmcA